MAFLRNAFGLSHIGYGVLWKAKSFTDANKGATSESKLNAYVFAKADQC